MSALDAFAQYEPFGSLTFDSQRVENRTLPLWLVLAFLVAYILPGLVGHDPWKQDEAYVFGGVLDLLKDGDWIVMKVGGIPFMEKPPLYHWVAALTAKTFSPWLPLHDGARLASGIFVSIAVGAVAIAASILWGRGIGRVGALMTVSSAGLVTNAQMMLPDLPLMAGFALAVAGLAGCHARRPWGGVVLGVGVGVGFLAKGLLAPAVLGISAVMLPIAFPEWRTRRYARGLGIAVLACVPFLLIWPAVLWHRSPTLFMTWFWENNVGRYLGFSVAHLGAATERGFWLETWPWFLFPLWVFVAAALMRDARKLLRHPAAQIGLTISACMAAVLATSASARSIYALPMVPALALVAAGCARGADARSNRWLFASGVGLAALAALIVWYGWASLVFTSRAPDWPWLTQYLPETFGLEMNYDDMALAALLTLGFGAASFALNRAPHRGVAIWVAGIATAWGLVTLLWLPWIDNAKSYRGAYESLARAIPRDVHCVSSMDLGESERAVLEYVLGIPTIEPGSSCAGVLRQLRLDRAEPPVPRSWRLLWSGSRPGDYRERFELWLRRPMPGSRGQSFTGSSM